MIAQLRVDDRLIHGQVALVWTKELNTPGIVVANDNAANNTMVQMTLKMATPTGKKLLIRTVDDAIKVFNNPKGSDMRIFALTNNIEDALKIAKNVKEIDGINVANVGRFANDANKGVQLSSTLMLSEQELTSLKELAELDIPVFNQVVPSNVKTPIKSLLKGK
ncbi:MULTISPECIES: PTS sugar transporter subunit IIB [unclassified Lactobacillus]|uniref:PTS system mannose/fructose/N-acetylgalactosamine-transporter subunit IIB n=1 Tax=unclassified Lactobacillus TaxID=2620435 RepID=UPI000EFA61FD|nr:MULTISPECIES: PTS sugar transporter subunit IIB [unclassified Lactobacillus]RMC25784.1 PTS mannose/fructose/sorbose transporter subunit IIB [Lactobacillus sp. ESL0247]RMC29596.1 PTS mannose/fructose/sorbose transporter subunit IIB [Lactobacillus sp. ESL0246]RMC33585.1 PTS mannose/fructose/sorbose transporter subunit IIB [Lactobacillus sp. ESL0245]RMC51595.1 PTS mannose/fructose/sorbose transporter subunit IIB [Lactobacillus sp. ESL0228]